MFIIKGFFILILIIFALGLFASFWLRYTFKKMHKNMRKMHGMDENGEKVNKEKESNKSKTKTVSGKGEYVDFEEVN